MMQLAIDIGVMDHNVLLDAYQPSTGTEFMSARQKNFRTCSSVQHDVGVEPQHAYCSGEQRNPVHHPSRAQPEQAQRALPVGTEPAARQAVLLRRWVATGAERDVIAAGDEGGRWAALQATAIHRYVDAVLRPNAAHQPIWMSDPLCPAVAPEAVHILVPPDHTETSDGEAARQLRPATAYCRTYQCRSRLVRGGIVQGGGDDPEWKRGWGVSDYVGTVYNVLACLVSVSSVVTS